MRKIIGFILGFFSPLFFAVPAFAATVADPLDKRINIKGDLVPTIEIADLIRAIINLLFVVAVVVGILFLVYGGIRWIISGGDKSAVETARNTIVAAIVGLVIVFLAYFILTVVFKFLGIDFLTSFNIPTVTSPSLR